MLFLVTYNSCKYTDFIVYTQNVVLFCSSFHTILYICICILDKIYCFLVWELYTCEFTNLYSLIYHKPPLPML